MSDLILLQSGYVTLASDKFTYNSGVVDDVVGAIKTGMDVSPSDNAGYYSQTVTELFQEARTKNLVLKDFDFRERVYRAAISHFGENLEFFKLQFESEYLSATHRLLLLDTLKNRLRNGTRMYSIESWSSVISRGQKYPKDQTLTDSVNDAIKALKDGGMDVMNNKFITCVVASWVSAPDGVLDLLTTLNICFGKRG